jgi:hypothetical protein
VVAVDVSSVALQALAVPRPVNRAALCLAIIDGQTGEGLAGMLYPLLG